MDWFPEGTTLADMMPQWNFRHLCDDVIPALRKEGVTEEQIVEMTIDNPRRVFECQSTY